MDIWKFVPNLREKAFNVSPSDMTSALIFCRWLSSDYGTPLQYSCLKKSHGQRSLVGCSPWGREESDTTEWLHFHTFLTLKFLNIVNRSECFYCCYLLSPSSLTLTCLGHLRFRLIRMRLPALNHLWLAEPATPYAWACAVCPWADTPSFCFLMPWCCSLHSCLQLILNSAV